MACIVALFTGCSNPDRDYEKAFQADSIVAYQDVLKKHPNHQRAKEANTRLGLLFWKAAKDKREIEAVKDLIRNYPEAEFAGEAKSVLDDLSWESAQSKNTEQSYGDYASNFRMGKHVFDATARIEEIALQTALDAKAIDPLNAFLEKYPQSARKTEVEQQIKYLRKQELVKIFEKDDLDGFKKRDDGTLGKTVQDLFGGLPLLVAADTPSEKIAAYLIEKGADVNKRAEDASTPLHRAAQSGSVGVAKLLIANKADVNAAILAQSSAITIRDGRTSYHAPPPTAKKGTPLHWAAFYNRPEVLDYLIEQGARVNADDGYGNTPLHFAAQSGSMKMIRSLIKAGADWKTKGRGYGSPNATPLHYAKTVEIAEFFVKQGIAIDMDSDLGQPIHSAAHFGHTEVIGYLLKQGTQIKATCSWSVGGWSSVRAAPLWIAAYSGTPELIDFLADKGGDIHYKVGDGGSLLHAAAMGGNVPVIKHLVDKKLPIDNKADFPHAMPMVRGWQGITPLGVAIHYGQIGAVTALLDAGADVNAHFSGEWTPLYVAIVGRSPQMVTLLLERNAQLPCTYSEIDTRNTSDDVKALLKKHFAKTQDKAESKGQK